MEKKGKHLDFIQLTITRMAANSFLLKGWSVTVVAALFALSSVRNSHNFVWLALIPCLMFWGLDGFFLRQERLFRKLYDDVRVKDEDQIDFSMNTLPYAAQVASWLCVSFSRTLFSFHGALFASILLVYFFIKAG